MSIDAILSQVTGGLNWSSLSWEILLRALLILLVGIIFNKLLLRTVDRLLGRPEGASEKLITYVTDRAGHDLRYAIDSRKLKEELGWEPSLQFEEGIEKTVRWYLANQEWMDDITSGEYERYYQEMYTGR